VINNTKTRSDIFELWKSFTVPETVVFQKADCDDLIILACAVFGLSTRATDKQTDKRNCNDIQPTRYNITCCHA